MKIKRLFADSRTVQEIKAQRLRWEGHIRRLNNGGLVILIWKQLPTGRTPVGRPRLM